MKKTPILLLCALLALNAACSKGKTADETDSAAAPQADVEAISSDVSPAGTGEASEEPAEGTETNALPENVEVSAITELELARPTQIENGILVMYFTDEELFYEPDAPCSIGLISSDMADSISGTFDMTSYPDMFSGDDYRGAAIVPSEPIPSGNYTFSVSFGNYLVNFDMTVD